MRFTVRTPASSANLGPGFDALGLALGLWNEITIDTAGEAGRIVLEGEEASLLNGRENLAETAMRRLADEAGRTLPPFSISVRTEIPVARGLGSSAAALIAGLVAADILLGTELPAASLFSLAWQMEGHGDNACPAVFGGMQVCVHADGRYLRAACRYPAELSMAILVPDHSMATKEARKVLPDSYSKADLIHNTGRAALFVGAMAAGRMDLLDEATQDRVHQPQRAALFPPLFDIFASASTEIIAKFATIPACQVAGVAPPLFDAGGAQCNRDAFTCLIGTPVSDAQLDICNKTIAGAKNAAGAYDQPTGQKLAVAVMLAAAHTCE